MAQVTLAQVHAMLAQQERKLTQQFEARLQQVEATWQTKLTQAQLGAREMSKGRKKSVGKNPCFCCGGVRAVHQHRELEVPLDDKCRKQVETFRQGGMITERRAAWTTALRHIGANRLAQEMLVYIEGNTPASITAPTKKRKLCPTDEALCAVEENTDLLSLSECTICQDDTDNHGATKLELPCKHNFHRKCIVPWLQENPHCPLCRTEVRLEFPTGELADVKVFATKPCVPVQPQLPCTTVEGGVTCCSYVVEESTPPLGGLSSAMPMPLSSASDVCNPLGLSSTPSNDWLLGGSFDVEMSQLGTQLSEEKSCSSGSKDDTQMLLPAPRRVGGSLRPSLASLVGSPSAAPGGMCGALADSSKLYGVASDKTGEGCKLDDDWLSFLRDKDDEGGAGAGAA